MDQEPLGPSELANVLKFLLLLAILGGLGGDAGWSNVWQTTKQVLSPVAEAGALMTHVLPSLASLLQ